MLEKAEYAARVGDFISADRLLRDIARIQVAELGPQHPELANTLNNLAIVAERGGRADDAESFYRQSAAIASASLPADHPMVVTSRQNLEAFRRARQSSMDVPSMNVSSKDADLGLDVFAREDEARVGEKEPATDKKQTERSSPTPRTAPPAAPSARSVRDGVVPAPTEFAQGEPQAPAQAPPQSQPEAPARDPGPAPSRASSGSRMWLVIGVLALVTVGVLASRSWTLRDQTESTAAPAVPEEAPAAPANTEPAPPPSTDAAPSPAAPPAASNETGAASTPPPAPEPEVVAETPPAAPVSPDGISLAAAQLCRSLSTSNWRCDPAGDVVGRGPLMFYTRVKSPRGGTVVHHWYHGDALQRSVPLRVRANPAEGFRTYSRLTIDEAGDWRVEARTEGGDLLDEQRFTVR